MTALSTIGAIAIILLFAASHQFVNWAFRNAIENEDVELKFGLIIFCLFTTVAFIMWVLSWIH